MIGGGMSHRGMFRRKGAGGFDPDQISDLLLWLDGVDPSTITEDAFGVSNWANKSNLFGASNDHSQSNNSNKGSYNGTDGIDFSGGNNFVINTAIAGYSGMSEGTFFCIFRSNDVTNSTAEVIQSIFGGGGTPAYTPLFYVQAGQIRCALRNSSNGFLNMSYNISSNTDYLITLTWDGNDAELFVDQISRDTMSGRNMVLSSNTKISAVSRRAEVNQYFFNGTIKTVLNYKRLLIPTEIAEVETYLIDRYNLTI